MMEPKEILDAAQEKMDKVIAHLVEALASVRAGKASTNLLNGVMVDYYGASMPVSQVASVTVPDARTVLIQPWEKNMIAPIEKAILAANIGLTPSNNGEHIRLNIPPLTEERRKELVKQIKADAETARVGVRNIRRDAVESFKKRPERRYARRRSQRRRGIGTETDGSIQQEDRRTVLRQRGRDYDRIGSSGFSARSRLSSPADIGPAGAIIGFAVLAGETDFGPERSEDAALGFGYRSAVSGRTSGTGEFGYIRSYRKARSGKRGGLFVLLFAHQTFRLVPMFRDLCSESVSLDRRRLVGSIPVFDSGGL